MATLQDNINQVNSDFNGIKTAITATGVEVADGTATSEYADKVNEVYEKGKQAEYNNLWDFQQDRGTRTDYGYGFAGKGWKHTIFYPKYNMQPTKSYRMFYDWTSGIAIDLVERLEQCGVTLDFSKCTDMGQTFMYSSILRIGVVDFSSAMHGNEVFSSCKSTQSIEKIIVRETLTLTNTFYNCVDLVNVVFEGVIGQNIAFAQSTKLSKASIENIFSRLSDTATGKTLTLNTTAVNNAFETSSGTADGSTSEEWLNLVATKPNWTISLS